MIEKLVTKLSSTDLEDYGTLVLKRVDLIDHSKIKLHLEISIDEEPEFQNNWEVFCSEVKMHNIKLGYKFNFDLENDHVLSWHFSKPHCGLSFNGETKNPLAVIGALYVAHKDITQDWIPFNRYFNEFMSLKELISGGFGQLVESAPIAFITAYEKVMREFNFSVSQTRTQPTSIWNENQRVSSDRLCQTMILGDSFVVAERFEAKLI